MVEVAAYVAQVKGSSTAASLVSPQSGEVERTTVEASFEASPGPSHLERYETEDALSNALSFQTGPHIVQRVRVPRLLGEFTFFPPLPETLRRLKAMRGAGEESSFASVEGTDLARAWELWPEPDGAETPPGRP